jgi:hypothetical protein
MGCELVLEETVDSEQVFVLQYQRSEQVFEQGDAMSVAFELEYEIFRPRLQLVPGIREPSVGPARPSRAVQIRRRRILVAVVAAAFLILLMLPIRALGGATLASAGPAQGQTYVVKSGDTLTSIARQIDPANVPAMTARLAAESGSGVLVPGEHIVIP